LILAAIQSEPGTSVTTAGYDKLKHDYDSRETTVNACLRENQKPDIEMENLKKDNGDKVKELKINLEEALGRAVKSHDMYPDMVRESSSCSEN
jgi:hypothetical protein